MRALRAAKGGAESPREHKEVHEGLLDKAKDELTGSEEEKAPKESGAQQHQSEDAPPPGEEPTTPGYDSPKTGPA